MSDGSLQPYGVRSQRPIDAVFSPDGRWVAYVSGPTANILSPDSGVFVRAFPASTQVYQAPRVRIDFHPVWGSEGKELIYVPSAASDQFVIVKVTPQGGLAFGAPIPVPARVTENRLNTQPRAFDILPDGRFLGLVEASTSDAAGGNVEREIRVVLNWIEELKARVPARP